MDVTAIILAGGKSSRFGCDKTLYPIEGKTMTERAVEILRPFVDEILISVDRKGKFCLPDIREIEDIYPETGPMGGIYSGLLSAKHEICIIIAGDFLQIDTELTKRLLAASEGFCVAIPVNEGRLEPLYGVYKRSMVPLFEKKLKEGDYRLWKLLEEVKEDGNGFFYTIEEERDKKFLYNVNFPEDVCKYKNSL